MTYYSFFATFSLALLGFAIFGFILDDQFVLHAAQRYAAQNLPRVDVRSLRDARNTVGAIAFIGLPISGWFWVDVLRSSIRRMWQLPEYPGRLVVRVLVDLLVLAGLGVLLAASLAIAYETSVVADRMIAVAGAGASSSRVLVSAVGLLLGLGVNTVVATAMLTGLPRMRMPWRRVLGPAVLVAVGFELLTTLGRVYVQRTEANPTYHLVAGSVGLLVFLNAVNQLVLFAAALTATSDTGRPGDLATDQCPDNRPPASRRPEEEATFPALREDDIGDLYDNAPCGFVSTLPDGTIAKINATLLDWLGRSRDDLVGRRHLVDLLAGGSRLYYETHLAPLLWMQGQVGGIALELLTADGTALPVLITSAVKIGDNGEPVLIRTTIFDARERHAYEQELLRARQRADRDRERLRLLVTGLQRSLLPTALPVPPGMATSALYHMASPDEVGGDFYDLFPLGGGRWGFFLGDVRGKGIGAAAVTAAARYTLRAAAVYDPEPAAVLTNLNAVLYQNYREQGHRHCTVIFGVLEKAGAGYTASIAAGGHPPALLVRANGATDYQTTDGGALVGIVSVPRVATRTIQLDPGDTLILYSDGLTEARTASDGERFGDDPLRNFVEGLGPTDAEAAVNALSGLLAGFEKVDDDVAVMAFSVSGA